MLYNGEKKVAYLNTIEQSIVRSGIEGYFKRIASKELEYGKDIVEMNANELIDTVSSLGIRRGETILHLLSLLRGYNYWASVNGALVSGAVNNITSDDIDNSESIRVGMIKDSNQLNAIIDNSLKREIFKNRSIRDELIIRLLYCGLLLSEIQKLKKVDVDYLNGEILIRETAERIKINSGVISLCKEYSQVDYIEKGTRSETGAIEIELVDSEYMFRPFITRNRSEGEMCSIQALTVYVKKVFDVDGRGVSPSPEGIRISGAFDRIYKMEEMGTDITPLVFVEQLRLGEDENSDVPIKARVRKWRNDYRDWKIAFNK